MRENFSKLLNWYEESHDAVEKALNALAGQNPLILKDEILSALKAAIECREMSSYKLFENLIDEIYLTDADLESDTAWYAALDAIGADINALLGRPELKEDDIENALVYVRLMTVKTAFDSGREHGFTKAQIKENEIVKDIWRELRDIFEIEEFDLHSFIDFPLREESENKFADLRWDN